MPSTSDLRVVVADETPMNRHLVRFFLERDGIQVVGETSRGDETASLAGKHRPDAVILDHRLADMDGADAIPLVHEASPSTRIVMFSPSAGEPPVALPSRGADVYLEKGVGLKDLSFVLRTLCASPFIATPTEPEAAAPAKVPRKPERHKRRWTLGMRTAAAASIAALALVLLRTSPDLFRAPRATTPPVAPSPGPSTAAEAAAHLGAAMGDLQELVDALSGGTASAAARLARDLLEERAAALAAGADVSRLDVLIAAKLGPQLRGMPPTVAFALQAILGPLLPGGMGSPTPAPPQGQGHGGKGSSVGEGSIAAGQGGGDASGGGGGGSGGGSGGGGGGDSGGGGSTGVSGDQDAQEDGGNPGHDEDADDQGDDPGDDQGDDHGGTDRGDDQGQNRPGCGKL